MTTILPERDSAKLILELIWSKISCHFGIEMPWNDGLHMDSIEPLLIAKAVRVGDEAGWMYNSVEFKEKRLKRDDDNTWEPAFLGEAEISAINIMAARGGYLPLDEGMNEYLTSKHDVTVVEVGQNLIATRLFMRDGEYIRPILTHTHVVTLDDTGYASSERDRLDLWCDKNGIPPYYLNLLFIE